MNKTYSLVADSQTGIKIGAKGLEEIEQNVRMILTTIKGTVYLYRLFGLSQSFVDAPTHKAIMQIQHEIYDTIEQYEPRVTVKTITFSGNDNGELNPTVVYEIKEGVLL